MSDLKYTRPTRTISLPSGKSCEVIGYLTNAELEDIQAEMTKGVIVSGDSMEAGKKPDIPMENLLRAYQKARTIAVRQLTDEKGVVYDANEENIREFFNIEDGKFLNDDITEMINGKKKSTSAN